MLLAVSMGLAGCGRFGFDAVDVAGPGDGPGGAWWDAAWSRRTRLRYENPGPDPWQDLPAAIFLRPDNHDAGAVLPELADLRIVDEDGVTLLPYEVEAY